MATNKKNTTAVESLPEAPIAVVNNSGQAITLIDDVVSKATASWSKAETRDALALAHHTLDNLANAAQSLMKIGADFNEFASKHSNEKCMRLVEALAALRIRGLSVSNIGLWRERASKFDGLFPNEQVKRHLLAATAGEGIIIRQASTEKDKPATYVLSPFYQKALEKVGKVPNTQNDEVAEKYVRNLVNVANGLRSDARMVPTLQNISETALNRNKAFIDKMIAYDDKNNSDDGEDCILSVIESTLQYALQHVTNIDLFPSMFARIASQKQVKKAATKQVAAA